MLCKIGDVEIWRVLENVAQFMPIHDFFPDLGVDRLRAHRHVLNNGGLSRKPGDETEWITLPIQAFLLKTPRHVVLVDACVGNDKSLPRMPDWHQMRSGRFMAALLAADIRPEQVNYVMCTHLHVDHIGWTTTLKDGRWIPTFPNATVLGTHSDLDFARAAAEKRPDGPADLIWRESILPLLDSGHFKAVPAEFEIDETLRFRPTPGHTPGHVAVEVAATPECGAAITGDLMHSPLQCALPELSSVVDHDKILAGATRRSFLDDMAQRQDILLGTHFPLPSIGRVQKNGQGFEWNPAL